MKRFNLLILEFFCIYDYSSPVIAVSEIEPPDSAMDVAAFPSPAITLKSQRSLSTVNHKKPIVKAMLKLASPVWSLVSSCHFISLPLIGPEEMSWWSFDPASAKLAG
ncbi:conserved hypothetical protein [Agrobacterium deltaense Zutra 3/1]|uniref:Uncharacterized protein n=1 Tax=Agrobacterium deltaense Zutra 3/1 TaxID=1183427 RepID=A0A1S7QUZ5_9HYPH|nr:conserved hypothetical protein [Agrobacterium deltaense Zutra 3/1]